MIKRKNILFLLVALPLFIFSCGDAEESTDTAEVDTETVDDTADGDAIIDYSTMSFADQEKDLNEKLANMRAFEANVPDDKKAEYKTRVDNLEAEIKTLKGKMAEYDADQDNETLKAEVQTMGDQIRNTAFEINEGFKSFGDQLKEDHDQKVEDVENAAEAVADGAEKAAEEVADGAKKAGNKIKEGVNKVGDKLKEHHNQKVEDVKEAADALKADK